MENILFVFNITFLKIYCLPPSLRSEKETNIMKEKKYNIFENLSVEKRTFSPIYAAFIIFFIFSVLSNEINSLEESRVLKWG